MSFHLYTPVFDVRANDGLALSSRHGYLSPKERHEAVRLHQQLQRLRSAIFADEWDFAKIKRATMKHLDEQGWKTDYISVRRQQDLLTPHRQEKRLVVLGASKLGATCLIDNLETDL